MKNPLTYILLVAAFGASAADIQSIMPGDDLAKAKEVYGPLADLANLNKAQIVNPPKAGLTKLKEGKRSVIIRENKDFGDYKNELQINLYEDKVVNKQYTVLLGSIDVEKAREAYHNFSGMLIELYGEPDADDEKYYGELGEDLAATRIWEEDGFYVQKRFAYDPLFGTQVIIVKELIDCPGEARCKLQNNFLVKSRESEEADAAAENEDQADIEKTKEQE